MILNNDELLKMVCELENNGELEKGYLLYDLCVKFDEIDRKNLKGKYRIGEDWNNRQEEKVRKEISKIIGYSIDNKNWNYDKLTELEHEFRNKQIIKEEVEKILSEAELIKEADQNEHKSLKDLFNSQGGKCVLESRLDFPLIYENGVINIELSNIAYEIQYNHEKLIRSLNK